MHPRAKVSPETCKFRRHGCPLAKSCQCQTHSINLHVRGVSDVARTAIRSNTCMDETDEAAGRGSEAEKPPGADLPSIARAPHRAMSVTPRARWSSVPLPCFEPTILGQAVPLLGYVSTAWSHDLLSSSRHRGSNWGSPGAAVRRTLEQPSVGASSSMPPDIVSLLWAPAQAP